MSRSPDTDERVLKSLFGEVVSRDRAAVARALAKTPALARLAATVGATRLTAASSFVKEIGHYVYAGDTALHVAAAAHAPDIAGDLLSAGANVRARNRRGAEPLHYAADGRPGSGAWNPDAQFAVVRLLINAGADPNAEDMSGVAPLHRAVRTRSASAVCALLENGADPTLGNKSGSTPLHLAVQNTGKSGSGSPDAREQQRQIIRLLLDHGASPSDKDAKGTSVRERVTAGWIQELLDGA